MAPVSRRSFLAGLIAAPMIAAVAPKVQAKAPTFRRYRVDNTFVAVRDADWGGPYRVSLWDGERFVKVVCPAYLGRAVVIPVETPEGNWADASFRLTGRKDAHGLDTLVAQYESGPKWWARG